MKQVLFLVIALLLIGSKAANAQMNADSKVICLEKREKGHGIRPINPEQTSPVTRGQVLQPAYAYICNGAVFADFPYETPSVTISVTNLSTGEMVHSETYEAPSQINLDLSQETSGEYYLEIVFDDFYLCGQFSL